MFVVLPNTTPPFVALITTNRRKLLVKFYSGSGLREAVVKNILVIGAGTIGSTIAEMLAGTRDYAVTIADHSAERLQRLEGLQEVERLVLDIGDEPGLRRALGGQFAVLSAAPYHQTAKIAQAVKGGTTHYLDLTEDVATTRLVRGLAAGAPSAFIPQCGLAPGFVSIVANDLAGRFDRLDQIKMRVGALPEFPSNALNYNLTWSTDGVINEYCEPCEAIAGGVKCSVPALEELEEFSLDGTKYEAFNTSGGLGSLCETFEGRIRSLNYRTIRYPGHCAIMKALLNDLRLRDRRDVLKDILENSLPATLQDVVVVLVTASGWRGDRFLQETYANKIYSQTLGGRRHSAIQMTTAAGICTVLDLLAEERLPRSGFVRQEGVPLESFLQNRFGRLYRPVERAAAAA
jgi:saccharopine dehydrogenase-like NADP-dependent oxidoreductase